MKRISYFLLTMAAAISISTNAIAQRKTDMAVKVTSPAKHAVMLPGVPTNVEISFTNKGPDKILEGDTILFMTSLNNYSTVGGWIMDSDLNAGKSITHFIDVISNNGTATKDYLYPICIRILNPNTANVTLGGKPFHVTYNDPDTNNNFNCDTAILKGNTTAVTSMAGIAEDEASIYPNPVAGNAHLNLTLATTAPVSISISNINGQVMLRQDLGILPSGMHKDIVLNTADLPNGFYLATMHIGSKVLYQKVNVVH